MAHATAGPAHHRAGLTARRRHRQGPHRLPFRLGMPGSLIYGVLRRLITDLGLSQLNRPGIPGAWAPFRCFGLVWQDPGHDEPC